MTISTSELSQLVKEWAMKTGFDDCGIARIEPLEKEKTFLLQWLKNGFHGKMKYLENHLEKRVNPSLLVENARSVIVCLLNYFPFQHQNPSCRFQVSKYAYGRDYHKVVKKMLKELNQKLHEHTGISGRCFVDSAPVLERVWAQKAGLGWIGKNTLLIHPRFGSWVFIGEIITPLELQYDKPFEKSGCQRCQACLNACPTHALNPSRPYMINASECISYHTIEDKNKDDFHPANKNWIFGCDICQDVCPFNRKAIFTHVSDFQIRPFIKKASGHDWENLTRAEFLEHFRGSALMRAGYEGILKNIDKVKKNSFGVT